MKDISYDEYVFITIISVTINDCIFIRSRERALYGAATFQILKNGILIIRSSINEGVSDIIWRYGVTSALCCIACLENEVRNAGCDPT